MEATLGSRMRAHRQRLRLTLKDLAEKTGLSVPYLSDLERGTGTNPTLEKLEAIALALGCPVAALLGATRQSADERPLPLSLQRFIKGPDFADRLKRLADRADRPADEMESEVITFLASAPKRARKDLAAEDWRRLLDFYMVIAES